MGGGGPGHPTRHGGGPGALLIDRFRVNTSNALCLVQEVEVVLERLGTSTATITLAATGEDVAELLRGSCSSVV